MKWILFVIEDLATFENSLHIIFNFKQITMKLLTDVLIPMHSTYETPKALSD